MRADEGAGQAAEPAEHGGGEGVDDQQGEGVGAQRSALDGRDEDAGQGGEEGADRPTSMVASRSGRPPLSCSRAGSSTTARMATPERVRTKRKRDAGGDARWPATKAMISCQVMLTPKIDDLGVGAEELAGRAAGCRGVGFQIQVARARKPSITPIGHDDLGDLRGARGGPASPPGRARAPTAGPRCTSTTISAIGAGQPQPQRTCQ